MNKVVYNTFEDTTRIPNGVLAEVAIVAIPSMELHTCMAIYNKTYKANSLSWSVIDPPSAYVLAYIDAPVIIVGRVNRFLTLSQTETEQLYPEYLL